jgi:menaquinone-dependent protoporphyrinogen oxidase
VIIGAPVYAGSFSKALEQWAKTYSVTLNSKVCGFFTVSGNAGDKRPEARAVDDMLLQKFITETGLRPQFVASFGGAIQFTKYNFFLRWMMKRISTKAGTVDSSKDIELTDWVQVGAFANAFAEQDMHSRFVASLRLNRQATPNPRHLAGRAA